MHDSVASAQKGDPTFVIHMAFRQALGIFQHQGKKSLSMDHNDSVLEK
jgi:hypothetical protein